SGELFNHDFRLSATDNRVDRIGIKYIGDRRLYTLFHQNLSFSGERVRATRACPLVRISAISGRPIAPVPPATKIFICEPPVDDFRRGYEGRSYPSGRGDSTRGCA